ncbi:protein kinase [Pectobacterium carotovorum subsp. carotovorum]|uniref:serine/threonine-protein kinase n=1 Tax=Pectobacterium carotovorum TaxID=554 RepID=UPI00027E0F3F|nr:serine/threonine-protein kinase [Pectobacterium carotovorum]AFR01809.1 protein kinase [Pectobacterium carotovorum subsp. carotovorum PCC21]GKV97132.1 protein kinase [Pectobacterium carotovorum subsp. carotovorum]
MIEVGKIIAERYKILSYVGKGGMQDVYKVLDLRLDLDLALKTPLSGLESKRFLKSAKIAAKINHHNIAKTFDYVEDNGNIFLAEEFVEGENLEEKLRHFDFLDPHYGACILHNLAKGIMASHKAGVIHRDLKPSNVMVSGGVQISNLKITDFGIATLTQELFDEAAAGGDLTRSTSGTIKGALPFMSPELMFGKKGKPIESSTDIWSLGAMMFKLLTGEYPFGVYLDAAVNVKTKNRMDWPTFMTANPQYQSLSQDLQKIVDNCLSYDPDKRPTAETLVKECEALCYLSEERHIGRVNNLIQGGISGFIDGTPSNSFFSMESVYGSRTPNTSTRNTVCYSTFDGHPHPRAHPVILWKD